MTMGVMEPRIKVSPNPALMDDVLNITIAGLQPGQDVTLRSRVAEGDHRFYGYAHYTSTSEGAVNTSMASLGGTYTGIHNSILITTPLHFH